MRFVITVSLCFSCLFCLAQRMREYKVRVDTTAGHGYELFFYSEPRMQKEYTVDRRIEMKQYYHEKDVNWPTAVKVIDSVTRLGYKLTTPSRLKKIFEITQAKMDAKRISIGSNIWQGIYGLYWCNKFENNPTNPEGVSLAGATDGVNFRWPDSEGKEVTESEGMHSQRLEEHKLIFYRTY